MQTKKLEVKHDIGERRFEVSEIDGKRMITIPAGFFDNFQFGLHPDTLEMIADQEQKWGEERLPTND